MSLFDPKKNGEGGGGRSDASIPSGEYLLALVWFERRRSKRGNDYLRAKYEVVAGQRAGATFFSNLSLDVASPGTAGRLSLFCACVGQEVAFDLGKDEEVRKAWCGKPFKARVEVRTEGGWTNVDLARYLPQLTDAERKAADGWVLDQQDRRALEGDAPSKGGKAQEWDDAEDDLPF